MLAVAISMFTQSLNSFGQKVEYDRFEDLSKVTMNWVEAGKPPCILRVTGQASIKGDASKPGFDRGGLLGAQQTWQVEAEEASAADSQHLAAIQH